MENPFINKKKVNSVVEDILEPKKDMKTVADYNRKRKLEMLRFTCLHCSARAYSGQEGTSVKDIINFAEALYNEVKKRDYLEVDEK